MVLTTGSLDALSFTDDTSLPDAGAKVSIHAQVLREPPPDWFYTLLQRAPDHAGELKSSVIAEVFFNLPDYERRKILATLKTVRIHISDPRPYTHDVNEALSDIVPGGDVSGFIKRLDKARQHAAESERRKLIARRMLQDAPPQQIRLKHLVWEYQVGLRISVAPHGPFMDEELMPYFEQETPEEFDFTPFERSKKNVVNVLSGFLSKSESVFCEAMDGMDEVIEHGVRSPMLVAYQLSRILSACHAFDKGDARAVRWIDGERQDVMNRIDRHRMFPTRPGLLPEVDSKESFLVQAADFAAGIAREIWRRNSLPHLTGTFDYVTYNGRRLSETEATTIATDLEKRKSLTLTMGWDRHEDVLRGRLANSTSFTITSATINLRQYVQPLSGVITNSPSGHVSNVPPNQAAVFAVGGGDVSFGCAVVIDSVELECRGHGRETTLGQAEDERAYRTLLVPGTRLLLGGAEVQEVNEVIRCGPHRAANSHGVPTKVPTAARVTYVFRVRIIVMDLAAMAAKVW